MPDHAGMRVPTGDSRKKHDDKQRWDRGAQTPAGTEPEKTKKTGADPPYDLMGSGGRGRDRRDHDSGARDEETYREKTGEPGRCKGAGVCKSGSSDSE